MRRASASSCRFNRRGGGTPAQGARAPRPSRWSAPTRTLGEGGARRSTAEERTRDDGHQRMTEASGERTDGERGGLGELRRNLSTLPNQLTASRLALVP